MVRANLDVGIASAQDTGLRAWRWISLGAALLSCVSCSSATLPSDDEGAVDDRSEALSGHPRRAGHPGSPFYHDGRPGRGGPAGHGDPPNNGGPSCHCDGTGHGHDHCGATSTGGATSIGGAAGNGGATSIGGTAGNGGAAGTGGTPQGNFTLSSDSIFLSNCQIPQTLTITNTSNVPLTWHVSGDLTGIAFTPQGSTLAAGDAVSASLVQTANALAAANLQIDADIAASQTLLVQGGILGVRIHPPADIDFGNVPLGVASPIVCIPVPDVWPGEGLQFLGNSASFHKSGVAPSLQTCGMGWTLYVQGWVPGPIEIPLQFISMSGPQVCAPNTFTARATIVAP